MSNWNYSIEQNTENLERDEKQIRIKSYENWSKQRRRKRNLVCPCWWKKGDIKATETDNVSSERNAYKLPLIKRKDDKLNKAMPEYPAVGTITHSVLWPGVLLSWVNGWWQYKLWTLNLVLRWSQQVVFRALCLRFYFGMDAFESTPLAFTSWLRSWRLVNCRVCNARGRMKGMQRLVMSSIHGKGLFF